MLPFLAEILWGIVLQRILAHSRNKLDARIMESPE
jgi:hypothetical protein